MRSAFCAVAIVGALSFAASGVAESSNPKKARFQRKAVPNGKSWHCIKSGEPVFDTCYRTRRSCESAGTALPDQVIGAPCVNKRRAVVVTFFDEGRERWRFHAYPRSKPCAAKRKRLLEHDKTSRISRCRRL